MSDSTTDAGERIQLRTGLLPLRLFLLQNHMRSRSLLLTQLDSAGKDE